MAGIHNGACKADSAITQAIGALIALRTEGNDLAQLISDLREARVFARDVMSLREEGIALALQNSDDQK